MGTFDVTLSNAKKVIFPPSFGASFWDDKANFEFKSQTTAQEFLQLNETAVSKSNDVKIVIEEAKNR